MVKVCSYNYPKHNETNYLSYYEQFSHPLHDFQKWSIESTVLGNHSLVCCPTASGKTLCGEFALEFFHSKGKKVIYTCPVKALSNQKFYDFTHKYPHISIGILTGDLKCNPGADVIICTTEILLNKLYQIKSSSNTSCSFEMNIETELGCVVFDEIHMISDPSRGHVWEQSIMLLPKHVQIIGLSASLGNPEAFACWIENKGDSMNAENKCVYLISKKERSVPLIHNSFITTTQGIFKAIKDKTIHQEINSIINKPFVIQDANGKFNDDHYFRMTKVLNILQNNNIKLHKSFVLNQLLKHLVEENLLPALCFVFSRKQLEMLSTEITTNLLEFDSKIPYTIDYECEQIIRKMPNYSEYLHLPEYINTVSLLRKGIGCHHAGTLPVLREMTEILFSKGYIKVLLCTETLAIGINMPVKSCIMTDVNKFDGDNNRILQPHEYQQISGRSGRLGIDVVGNVYHLNNLFRNIDSVSYKTMMKGRPQTLVSKFKISYNLLLNLIDIGETNYTKYAKRSMVQNDIDTSVKEYYDKISQLQREMDNMSIVLTNCKTPMDTVEEYIDLKQRRVSAINKKRKEIDRSLQNILEQYKTVEIDVETVSKYTAKRDEMNYLHNEITTTELTLETNVVKVVDLLKSSGFVNEDDKLSIKGIIASNIREIHCLVFAELIESGKLTQFSAKELVGILSCFTNVTVPDAKRSIMPSSDFTNVKDCVKQISEMYTTQSDIEVKHRINTGFDYTMHFDLIDFAIKWCECESDVDCKGLLALISAEKDIFLGEFIKAILKINNITSELEKVAEILGNMEFLSVLKEIPHLTLKFVATNQSLYV
jgi:superfamily II RNA helicase